MMINRVIISGGGTGGHIFPALAIADEIKKRNPNAEILFIGARGRMEMEKIPQRLYARLIQIPDTSNILEKQSSFYATWLIAACVCLVVTVNIFTLESVKQNSGNKSSDYYEYFSFLENSNGFPTANFSSAFCSSVVVAFFMEVKIDCSNASTTG